MGFARKDCGGPSSTLRKGGKSMVKCNIVFLMHLKLVLYRAQTDQVWCGLRDSPTQKGANVLEVKADSDLISHQGSFAVVS